MESNKNSEIIKTRVAQHYRYNEQCPIVAFECNGSHNGGTSDIIVVSSKRYLIDVEVKTSISDMRTDINKVKHLYFYNAYFGFGIVESFLDKRQSWKREWKNTLMYNEIYKRPMPENRIRLFYFAVPVEMVNQAKDLIAKYYPYAGLISCSSNSNGSYIIFEKKAHRFKAPRVSFKQIVNIVKSMSATLVRVSAKAEGMKLI